MVEQVELVQHQIQEQGPVAVDLEVMVEYYADLRGDLEVAVDLDVEQMAVMEEIEVEVAEGDIMQWEETEITKLVEEVLHMEEAEHMAVLLRHGVAEELETNMEQMV